MDVPNRAEHPNRKQGDHTSLHDGSYKLQMQQSAAGLPTPPHASREPASPSKAVGKKGKREFLDLIE
jgi:hypothetical protein